ncbi:ATP-binding protein [Sulfolobus sp. S-194]|uniref:ATP-binding protein n=1 Tax=Sulfolobus sp. S-194 TaxID=2512240 RepID=UPI001436D497|nr:ATP-binding protein [Sulfolobus sp. S-194]QIW23942.1 ATP-binding protein [Sulfolobus sp. S-194]
MDEDLLVQELSKKLEEADSFALQNSIDDKILGRVTRFETIRLGEKSYIGIDLAFLDYMNSNVKKGEYLAIRTIVSPVVVIGEVVSIERADMLAEFNIRESSFPRDPTTIMTQTFLELKPISEIENSVKRPAVTPIDPQSPVFRPKEDLLQDALGIPHEGIKIGKIFSGGKEIDAYVNLDEESLVHHILVIGTTGSGKTTLLKTILSQNLNALFFDRQGDFVRHLISRGEEFSVVMPSVVMMINDVPSSRASLELGTQFAERYGCTTPVSGDIRDNEILLECDKSIVHLIPYSINFTKVIDYMHKLTPYMSPMARVFWPVIMNNFKKGIDKIAENIAHGLLLPKERIESEIFKLLTPSSLLNEDVRLQFQKNGNSKSLIYYSYNDDYIVIHTSKLFRHIMGEDKNSETYLKQLDKNLSPLDLAFQTQDAIIRAVRSVSEFGIFNVNGTFDLDFQRLKKKTVVDLSWILDYTASVEAIAIVAYSILSDFYSYKDELYKKKKSVNALTILALDEAHEYFPQTRDEESKSIIEGLLNRLMRLGRVRKISVILATHMPDDLNPLVLQLSNTKIVMRNEENVLEKLGFEDYADILLTAPAGLGVIRSIKFSDVVIKTLKEI